MFADSERSFAAAVAAIAHANPFREETVRGLEKQATAAAAPLTALAQQAPLRPVAWRPQIPPLLRTAEGLAAKVGELIAGGEVLAPADAQLYEDLALFVLYFQYRDRLQQTLEASLGGSAGASAPTVPVEYYRDFEADMARLLGPLAARGSDLIAPDHLFACFFQVRRAFQLIFDNILGNSLPIQRLRADVWYSIFTHDLRRYRASLFDRMHDITTLVTGPSGTGKDLVAEAIGLSRYVAFSRERRCFEENVAGAFHAVNLPALSPQIIESELFGHVKGAFTGAVRERDGWFEICRPSHSVFLDEIGELDPAIQSKLLRLLQNRTFQRLGDTRPRRFEGKVIAATNRDLQSEVEQGRFRRDLFYRICSDHIQTPSLREQVRDDPEELPRLVSVLAQRICGEAAEIVARDVQEWIAANLPADYAWPGNIRELEQCVRNVLVRKEYHPLQSPRADAAAAALAEIQSVRWTADELLSWYCRLAYDRTGSYVAAAKRLGIDRRTVKQKVQADARRAQRGGDGQPKDGA